jgi:serine/threonine-protein kinase
MGSVWIARHLQLDIDVAVKFMTAEAAASANARMRFEREAKAAAKLKSAHIVQVFDYGVEDDVLHIVMELLVGEDLATRLGRVGRLPLPAVAQILGQACKGLTLAHEAGVVHRDLKPANIFLARDGHDEVVKVLDFGIAKAPSETGSSHSTRTGWLVGSPNYMSPEQIVDSKAVDWRSDIWALGVIAFECVTGREPFPGQEVGAILVSICSGPIPVPSAVAPDLGPEVDRFFRMALARPADERFQHALDFANALHALADTESPGATSSVPPRHSSAPPRFLSRPPMAPTAVDTSPLPKAGPVPSVSGPLPSGARPGEAPTVLMGSVSQSPLDLRPAGIRNNPSGRILGFTVATGLAVAGFFLVRPMLRLGLRPLDPPAASAPASAPPPADAGAEVPPAVAPALIAPASASPTPEETASAEVPATAFKQVRPVPRRPMTPILTPSSPSKPAVDCDLNYTLDSNGRKHFKPECFQ